MGEYVPFELGASLKEVIRTYWLGYDEYSTIEELYCQRDTEGRFSKAKSYLSRFIPEHAVVTIGVLTESDTMNGKRYKAGSRFRVDSNTRAFCWGNGHSDKIPQEVCVIEFSFPSFARLKECYDTYDSINATEKNQEKFYGIITGMCNYNPTSKKVKKGVVITALNMASSCFQPDVYTSKAPSTEALPGQTFFFIDEIKAFDQLIKNESNWNQTWTCAALMAMKKYGTDDEKLNEGLLRLDNKQSNTIPTEKDGMTHIVEEWKTDSFLGEKGTRYSQFENQVSYCLYCIDKWMKDVPFQKIGNNWKSTASKYKDKVTLHQFM